MNVKRAKTAGFCFGVKRAVETVYEQAKNSDAAPIYTYGPIIHNEEVVKDLENQGVIVLRTEQELEQLTEGTVIIRSHGVAKYIYEKLEKKKIQIVDATCPFVKKIHRIVNRESAAGKQIVIIGNPKHPEVEGIRGWAGEQVFVVETKEDAASLVLDPARAVCVAMIVIGDKHSSNTQKLFEICKGACKDTYYIQTLDDLDLNQLGSVETVGITAGASTPNNIIEEVQNNVRIIF